MEDYPRTEGVRWTFLFLFIVSSVFIRVHSLPKKYLGSVLSGAFLFLLVPVKSQKIARRKYLDPLTQFGKKMRVLIFNEAYRLDGNGYLEKGLVARVGSSRLGKMGYPGAEAARFLGLTTSAVFRAAYHSRSALSEILSAG